jgi:hypothetical protein
MTSYAPATAALEFEPLETRVVPSASEWVTSLYVNLLDRVPQPAEVAFWVQALDGGASPQQVAQGFADSLEFRLNLIERSYLDFLGRQPGPAEVNGWLDLFQRGLEPEEFQALVLASDEFVLQGGINPVNWLTGVYFEALGRLPDAVGLNVWLLRLQAGANRQEVALGITDSQEAHARTVVAVYRDMLGRAPDATGLTTWVSALDQGLTLSQLLSGIAASAEYIGLTADGSLGDVDTVTSPAPISPTGVAPNRSILDVPPFELGP